MELRSLIDMLALALLFARRALAYKDGSMLIRLAQAPRPRAPHQQPAGGGVGERERWWKGGGLVYLFSIPLPVARAAGDTAVGLADGWPCLATARHRCPSSLAMFPGYALPPIYLGH